MIRAWSPPVKKTPVEAASSSRKRALDAGRAARLPLRVERREGSAGRRHRARAPQLLDDRLAALLRLDARPRHHQETRPRRRPPRATKRAIASGGRSPPPTITSRRLAGAARAGRDGRPQRRADSRAASPAAPRAAARARSRSRSWSTSLRRQGRGRTRELQAPAAWCLLTGRGARMKRALIVHGGCGTPPPGEEAARNAACERAAEAGWKVLQARRQRARRRRGGGAALEDEPLLNAGTGAYLQADGVARLDASIMADDGRAGAVAQVPLAAPPGEPRALPARAGRARDAGGPRGARRSRRGSGTRPASSRRPRRSPTGRSTSTRPAAASTTPRWPPRGRARTRGSGTVGCVALDAQGRLAAATSTGGTGQCYPGRVGDTPIIGAGTYCTPRVGACR